MSMKNKGMIISLSLSEKKGTAKHAVDECLIIKDFGMEGDAHAGSEGQLTVLCEDTWKRYEKSTGLEIHPGECSENIIASGLSAASCPPGTVIKLGEEVTCLVIRIGKEIRDECPAYPRLKACPVAEEGLFLKVLTGGTLRAGDPVEITEEV